ncbi:MAG: Aromatase WhiE VI, partial [uncultured Pseudonocardia sp.]
GRAHRQRDAHRGADRPRLGHDQRRRVLDAAVQRVLRGDRSGPARRRDDRVPPRTASGRERQDVELGLGQGPRPRHVDGAVPAGRDRALQVHVDLLGVPAHAGGGPDALGAGLRDEGRSARRRRHDAGTAEPPDADPDGVDQVQGGGGRPHRFGL